MRSKLVALEKLFASGCRIGKFLLYLINEINRYGPAHLFISHEAGCVIFFATADSYAGLRNNSGANPKYIFHA